MNIGFISLFLFFLIESGELKLVKREGSKNCIWNVVDEYEIILPYFKKVNQNSNKFLDPKFNNCLLGLDSTIWSKQRASEQYSSLEPSIFYVNRPTRSTNGGPYVPSGVASSTTGSSKFVFNINNDLNDAYTLYWIDYKGIPVAYNTIAPNSKITQSSFYYHIWFLQNNNPNKRETLYIKLGVVPFGNSDVTVNLSNILTTVEDIISKDLLKPFSYRQGTVSDSYLLACFISLYARYPEKILSSVLFPSKFKSTGAAVFKVWDYDEECWKAIIADDYLPTSGGFYYGASASNFNEYWAPLLEKVFAKLVGGYPNLAYEAEYLSVESTYRILLGPINYNEFAIPFPDPYLTGFNEFLSYYKKGSVVSFTSRGDCDFVKTGLLCESDYGLLDVKENVAGTQFTLIKIQNPVGFGGEWIGDWSDSSLLWYQYPSVKAALNFESKNDGIFWIEKADFAEAFLKFYSAQRQIKIATK